MHAGSYKIILLGESGVGKSSLVLRFTRNYFVDHQESTIGAAFMTHTLKLDGDQTVKFEIWDTAGQERYRSLAPMYYRNCLAGLVVFDVSNPSTYQRAKYWIRELRTKGTANMVIALVANKTDTGQSRRVEQSESEAYAQQEGLVYVETSAKLDYGVTRLFEEVGKRLLEVKPKPPPEPVPVTITVTPTKDSFLSQKCQCL